MSKTKRILTYDQNTFYLEDDFTKVIVGTYQKSKFDYLVFDCTLLISYSASTFQSALAMIENSNNYDRNDRPTCQI